MATIIHRSIGTRTAYSTATVPVDAGGTARGSGTWDIGAFKYGSTPEICDCGDSYTGVLQINTD